MQLAQAHDGLSKGLRFRVLGALDPKQMEPHMAACGLVWALLCRAPGEVSFLPDALRLPGWSCENFMNIVTGFGNPRVDRAPSQETRTLQ